MTDQPELKPCPLEGEWRHSENHVCCGSVRVFRNDVDTNPSPEFLNALLSWVCDRLNRRPAPPQSAVNSSRETVIEVFAQEGDEPFICAVYGRITINVLEEIEDELNANPGEQFGKGDGIYSFTIRREPEQTGEFGRVEIPACWDLTEVGFRTFEEDENRRDEPPETELDRAWAWFRETDYELKETYPDRAWAVLRGGPIVSAWKDIAKGFTRDAAVLAAFRASGENKEIRHAAGSAATKPKGTLV